jgi:hypothetical protein
MCYTAQRMNTLSKTLLTLAIGTLLGLFATWFAVFRGDMPGGISDGAWRTSLVVGSTQGGLMTRAAVALHGLLALNRAETLYYTAHSDSAGATLTGDCIYHLTGRDPDARWWSITAYGADDYLIPNPANRYSISKNEVVRDAQGAFTADVALASHAANWIPVARAPFTLTLRLYNPGAAAATDPAHAALPTITKVSCP